MIHKGQKRFDVARGISAFVVFVVHTAQVFLLGLIPPSIWQFFGYAARGAVLVFFLLSGYLITQSIVANIKKNSHFDAIDYTASRIARLYPPLLFALALTVVLVSAVHQLGLPGSLGPLGDVRPQGFTYDPSELPHALLLLDGMTVPNGPLWSLYIEAAAYLAVMGLALVGFGSSLLWRIFGLFCLWITVRHAWGNPVYIFFFLVWLFGASLVLIQSDARFAVASGLLLILVMACPAMSSGMDSATGMRLQAAICVPLAYILIAKSWAEFRFPDWLEKTGSFSYTLYVSHFPILAFGLSVALATGANILGAGVVSAIVVLAVIIPTSAWLEDTKTFKRMLLKPFRDQPTSFHRT